MAKKKAVERVFPLVEMSREKRNKNLFENPKDDEVYNFTIPDYVSDNLKHKLRSYQAEALFNLNWTQLDDQADMLYNQLLFNMATGSGKTDLMAAIMLYMYGRFDYQEFLFVANSNAVVSKTKENFLNEGSIKYLLQGPITIAGQRILIKGVDRFPLHPEKGTIYLRLATIQTLANELGSYRENGLTYEDLAKRKLVILADEAHHYNVSTKKERADEASWESVLDKVREANTDNRQFEFTATIDVDKEAVYEKYKNKIIYKYELNRFMSDGYSKRVRRLESNQNDQDKMMNAVLLSQFRKRIAKENGIDDFKPVILFKSNKIQDSLQARDTFLEMMKNLTAADLENFIKERMIETKSETLSKTYEYWNSQDYAQTVAELKRDFQALTTINVNDKGKSNILDDAADFQNLNTLENPNNPLRTIFAVAKLTEGWDVLNLYDIVRLGEKVSSVNETNQEAQLIGRGARYYPFVYHGKSSYTRRFDNDHEGNRWLLETLFYHTINNPVYLERLHKSLNTMNLLSESDDRGDYDIYTATVKPEFKQTAFYQDGNLYQNELKTFPDEDYISIDKYEINGSEIKIDMNSSTQEANLNDEASKSVATEERTAAFFALESDQRLIKKAIARDSFFRFATLKQYIPTLESMDQFLHDSNWLGNLRVKAVVAYNAPTLTLEQRCNAVQRALSWIKTQLIKNYKKKRGTSTFNPIAVHDVIVDYQKRVAKNPTGKQGTLIEPQDMSAEKWYAYDYAINDQLEQSLIGMIKSFINDTNLKEKYDKVYLLRIEESLGKFKLYEYETKAETHYQAYMPDFILCLGEGAVSYQIFIEPKGIQLLEQDKWKEEFLENLDPDKITILGEDPNVKLLGVKFYTNDRDGHRDIHHTEKELREKLNVQEKGVVLK